MSLAGLGAFAGGAAVGINNGARVAAAKQGIDASKKRLADDAMWGKLLTGIMQNDPNTINMLRGHLGVPMPSQQPGYQAAPVAPMGQAEPMAEPGLGTL